MPRHDALPDGDVTFADSVTDLARDPRARDQIVASGSHGGRFSALVTIEAHVRAIAFNDAGLGMDLAGIAGLPILAAAGIPAVAVAHTSARIGRAIDTFTGIVTHVNGPAAGLGCSTGETAEEALSLMRAAPKADGSALVPYQEHRRLVVPSGVQVWALDSASLVRPADRDSVVVTGSHGGLVGGDAARAIAFPVIAAIFNDAGGGKDDAGWARLAVLDDQGTPAATVSAATARIGDGMSTFQDGVVSHVNSSAAGHGAAVGMQARDLVDLMRRAAAENSERRDRDDA
jgi:hypothetical protein